MSCLEGSVPEHWIGRGSLLKGCGTGICIVFSGLWVNRYPTCEILVNHGNPGPRSSEAKECIKTGRIFIWESVACATRLASSFFPLLSGWS